MQKEGLVYLGVILALSAIVALIFPGIFPIEDVSLYLTVTGLIYGLLAAFAITITWDRYSNIVENIHEEISSEMNAHELLKNFSDKRIGLRYAKQLVDYSKAVTQVPWSEYFDAEKVHKKFRKLFDVLGRAKPESKQDEIILESCLEELRDASTARSKIIIRSNTPLSQGIWALLLLLSMSVVIGIFMVVFASTVLGIFTKLILSLSSFAILLVIHQIDALELAAYKIEEAPNIKTIALLEADIANLEFKLGARKEKEKLKKKR